MTSIARYPVVGVTGGCGGVGASFFAAVLAVCARGSMLVDLVAAGGGIDVLVGIEDEPGARWSGLQVAGGFLDSAALRAGLPRVDTCSVLAADAVELDAAAVGQVLDAAAASAPVVVDLPRLQCAERAAALLRCDLLVVVARADVVGLVAANALVSPLPELPIGAVVRRGQVAPEAAAELVGAPLLGVLPPLRAARAGFDAHRLPRASIRVASGIWAGLRPRADRVVAA